MSDTSRYRKYEQHKYVPRRRRIKVWGVDEDTGKWQRCWNCGFMVNVDRDMGNPDRSGIQLYDNPHADVGGPPHQPGINDQLYVMATIDAPTGLMGSTAVDPNVTSYYTPRESRAVAGCKFCGCTNL